MANIYYDEDADLSSISGDKIAIIGYGIQGRNQALNMRDSGLDVIIGNIGDKYAPDAIEDGFDVYDPGEAAKRASIIYMLIPDDAQSYVYEKYIQGNMTENKAIMFAHGFSLRYKRIVPPENVDVMLMAPRMPGKQIREFYLRGTGAPVFISVKQNVSGRAKDRVLAMAKAIGATRVGAIEVSVEEETEVDHFIEHFLIPVIVRAMHLSYDFLVEAGYSKEVALLETYASAEIGELLIEASKKGLYKAFQDNTSPTAQFGMAHYSEKVFPDSNRVLMADILESIRSGKFANILKKEGESGYPRLKEAVSENNSSDIMLSHKEIMGKLKLHKK